MIEYLTKEKKIKLEEELYNLKTLKRKENAEALGWAKSLGDLSENAEYSQAREDQSQTEARISELEYILQNAIISEVPHVKDYVDVGTVVIVKKEGGSESEFTIVGSEDVDIDNGKISHQSPIGLALIGKKKGDKVLIKTPNGEVKYTVLNIV